HDAGGRLSGLLTMAALKKVAPDARAATLIKAITCPLDQVTTASPADPVTNLLGVSDGCSEGRTLVVDNGRLVGIISPSDISTLKKVADGAIESASVRTEPATSPAGNEGRREFRADRRVEPAREPFRSCPSSTETTRPSFRHRATRRS